MSANELVDLESDDKSILMARFGYLLGTIENIRSLRQFALDCDKVGGPCESCRAAGMAADWLDGLIHTQADEWGISMRSVESGQGGVLQ